MGSRSLANNSEIWRGQGEGEGQKGLHGPRTWSFLVKASSMLQDKCGQDDYEDDFARTEACFCWKLDSHTASWTCNLHSLPLAWIVFQKMGTYELVLHGQQSFGGCMFNIKRLWNVVFFLRGMDMTEETLDVAPGYVSFCQPICSWLNRSLASGVVLKHRPQYEGGPVPAYIARCMAYCCKIVDARCMQTLLVHTKYGKRSKILRNHAT